MRIRLRQLPTPPTTASTIRTKYKLPGNLPLTSSVYLKEDPFRRPIQPPNPRGEGCHHANERFPFLRKSAILPSAPIPACPRPSAPDLMPLVARCHLSSPPLHPSAPPPLRAKPHGTTLKPPAPQPTPKPLDNANPCVPKQENLGTHRRKPHLPLANNGKNSTFFREPMANIDENRMIHSRHKEIP